MAPGLRNSRPGIFVFEWKAFSQLSGKGRDGARGAEVSTLNPNQGPPFYHCWAGLYGRPDHPGQRLTAKAWPQRLLELLGAGWQSPVSPWCQLFSLQPRGASKRPSRPSHRQGPKSHNWRPTWHSSVPSASGPRLPPRGLGWLSTHRPRPSAFIPKVVGRTQAWDLGGPRLILRLSFSLSHVSSTEETEGA